MTNQSELARAIEGVKTIKPSTLSGREWEYIDQLLLAAKRLQTIEQATGTDHQHLQFSLQLLTRAEQAERRVQELEKELLTKK